MKKHLALLCSIFLLAAANVEAADKNNSPLYLGIKGGFVDADGMGDAALNLGLDVGYTLNRHLAAEVELTQTLVDGDTPSGRDWDVDTLSVFAAFRSNTEVKLKAKVGLTNFDSGGRRDTEFSFGLGVGFWAAGGLMEIEYTELDDGLDFISIGVNYFY
ncbi:MAG: porin family protein [Gammaproteobacteria bacterium]|nr:porin family protein [Gammaproteobacteria bacterium]